MVAMVDRTRTFLLSGWQQIRRLCRECCLNLCGVYEECCSSEASESLSVSECVAKMLVTLHSPSQHVNHVQ